MTDSPWASGPGEILQHGLSLLRKDSDVHRRLAMINIDNAVELMIKTYLGLPKRVTGIQIGRDRFREISESFPKLLDALEEHAPDKLNGLELGIIEWYHRLRNELYHQGNGLTVERDKVEVYSEIARLLFKNLFGMDLPVKETDSTELLGAFMELFAEIETLTAALVKASRAGYPSWSFITNLEALTKAAAIDSIVISERNLLRVVRNKVSHGLTDHKEVITPALVERTRQLTARLQDELKRLTDRPDSHTARAEPPAASDRPRD
jgi:hypothetical protein